MKTQRKLKLVAVDFNPWLKLIWTERLPHPLPRGYSGGRRVRQYRMRPASFGRIYDACIRAGFIWSQDSNGVHLRNNDEKQTN
jgi:hypothetical protein